MFCIVAFVVLGVLGIFSATNRALAKEALDCVLRRVTLRPCNTGFDEKMKSKILGSVITRSARLARFINRYFEPLSWIFFVLMIGSTIWAVRGVYLFYVTGSCNGLNQAAFCVFDPKGENNQVSTLTEGCKVTPTTEKDLTLQGVNLDGFPVLNKDANDKIVFIGCYACDYTRKAYPMILKLVEKYHSSLIFLHYPVKEKTDYMSRLGYCIYQENQEKYWQFNNLIFATDKANLENEAYINKTLDELKLNHEKITACTASKQTEDIVQTHLKEIAKTNFYGTPTIFINNGVLVGPKPYRVYAIMLKGFFYWLR